MYELTTYCEAKRCDERVIGSKTYRHKGQAIYAARAAARRLGQTVSVLDVAEHVFVAEFG